MLYKLYCRGHSHRFKSAGGDVKKSRYFCSGCRKEEMHKFGKSQDGTSCGEVLYLVDTFAIKQI